MDHHGAVTAALVAFVIDDECGHVCQIDAGRKSGPVIEMAMLLHGHDQDGARADTPLALLGGFAFDLLNLGTLDALVPG